MGSQTDLPSMCHIHHTFGIPIQHEMQSEELRGEIRRLKSTLSVERTRYEADMAAFQEKYDAMLATTSERSLALSEAHRREFEEQLAAQARAVGSARLEADAELVHEKIKLMRHKDELDKRIRIFEQRIATLNERLGTANSKLANLGESSKELKTTLAENELKARAREIELSSCKMELAKLRTSRFDASVQAKIEAARLALEDKERTFTEARSIEHRAQRNMEDHYVQYEKTVKEKVHLEVQLNESIVRETEEKRMREEAEKREHEEKAKREEAELRCKQLEDLPLEVQISANSPQGQEQPYQRVAKLEHEIIRIRKAHAREMQDLKISFNESQRNVAASFAPSVQVVPIASASNSKGRPSAEYAQTTETAGEPNDTESPRASSGAASRSLLTPGQEILSISMLSMSDEMQPPPISPAHQNSYEQELKIQLARSRDEAHSLEKSTLRLQNSLRLSQTSEARAQKALQWHVTELERVRSALDRATIIVEQFEEQKKERVENKDGETVEREIRQRNENLKYLKNKHNQELQKMEEKFEARLRNERREMRSRLSDAQDHGEANEEKLSVMASKLSAHKQAALDLQEKLRQNVAANHDAVEQMRTQFETKLDECKQEGELALEQFREKQNAIMK